MSDGRAHFTHFMLRTLLRMRQGEGYIRVTAGSLRNDSRLINNTKKKKTLISFLLCLAPPATPQTHFQLLLDVLAVSRWGQESALMSKQPKTFVSI